MIEGRLGRVRLVGEPEQVPVRLAVDPAAATFQVAEVLAAEYDGLPLHGPNDVKIGASSGTIFFTDPGRYFGPEKGDVYNIGPPASRVNNIIVGRTWIDTFGEMQVNNLRTKQKATIRFKECSVFGTGRWEVSGELVGADGETKHVLSGKWNESVTVSKPDGSESKTIWRKEPMPEDPTKYGFTNFTFKQNITHQHI